MITYVPPQVCTLAGRQRCLRATRPHSLIQARTKQGHYRADDAPHGGKTLAYVRSLRHCFRLLEIEHQEETVEDESTDEPSNNCANNTPPEITQIAP
uniref:Uncharacterized protein n=1 Tax=Timema monikensis TaxID=170555 RepID=A0A7R9EHK9_9NEOP|nr:unnamed protein product [Timema monikensis]